MSLKIGVIGKTGQVAQSLDLVNIDFDLYFLDRAQCNFSEPGKISEALSRAWGHLELDFIVNCVAYTNVDLAESESEMAFLVNEKSPEQAARWARQHDIPFIQYSTDYVYRGDGSSEMREDEAPAPQSVYGRSKLAGDLAVLNANRNSLIFRTSWVHSPFGSNFVLKMLQLAQEHSELSVVDDQVGNPTYAPHLAQMTLEAIRQLAKGIHPPSVIHLCNSGNTSWYGLAQEVFSRAKEMGLLTNTPNIQPVTTDKFPRPAQRPNNSRLSTNTLRKTFNITPPPWQRGVLECLQMIEQRK